MSEDDDNLIEVKAWKADGDPFLVLHTNPDEPYCGHHGQVQVNKDRRRVTCAKCGSDLDPIEVLWWLATKERELVSKRELTRALDKRIMQLQDEERRVKARLKRAQAKEQ